MRRSAHYSSRFRAAPQFKIVTGTGRGFITIRGRFRISSSARSGRLSFGAEQ
jgi:hypothetical protein